MGRAPIAPQRAVFYAGERIISAVQKRTDSAGAMLCILAEFLAAIAIDDLLADLGAKLAAQAVPVRQFL